jgi:hypothetical protein
MFLPIDNYREAIEDALKIAAFFRRQYVVPKL